MRGKHGNAAAIRREVAEHEAEIATYRKRVARLTAEVADLKRKREHEHRAHTGEVRRLKAQVREGIGPGLLVAQREAATLRDERDALAAQLKDMRRIHDTVIRNIVGYFESVGDTHEEAVGRLVGFVEPERKGAVIVDDILLAKKIDDVGVERIQRARGQRR